MPRGTRFYNFSRFEQVEYILFRNFRNEIPHTRPYFYQTIRRQAKECFADGGSADFQFFREILDVKLFTGFEIQVENTLLQILVSPIRQGGRFTFRCFFHNVSVPVVNLCNM